MNGDDRKQKRRDFMKRCSGIGMAGLACLSCGRNRLSGPSGADTSEFAMTAYCTLQCDECDAYKATVGKDAALKAQVAERWGMNADDVDCLGCKSENAMFNCTAKQCAIRRNLATCAHCPELAECDNEQWTKYPALKERATAFRARLIEEKRI